MSEREPSSKWLRNQKLWNALRRIRQTPRSQAAREEWIYAAIDLTKAVFVVQFASMRNSQDREDLEQAALLVFHKVANKLSLLTDKMSPDILFRVLFTVAKYSMFRELAQLKKHMVFSEAKTTEDENSEDYCTKIALSLSEEDVSEDESVEPHEVFDDDPLERAAYFAETLPAALLVVISRQNLYEDTPWGPVVKFCALQRLRGRYPSMSFVRAYWRPPDPLLAAAYGEHLARSAVLNIGTAAVRL